MNARPIDEAAVSSWMDAYGAAWLAGDVDGLIRLFALDASFQERRFSPVVRGAAALRDYWRAALAGPRRDLAFEHNVVALRGYTACIHWHASFTLDAGPTELDALSRVAFSVDRNPDGLLVAYAWDEWVDGRDAEMLGAALRRPLSDR